MLIDVITESNIMIIIYNLVICCILAVFLWVKFSQIYQLIYDI